MNMKKNNSNNGIDYDENADNDSDHIVKNNDDERAIATSIIYDSLAL